MVSTLGNRVRRDETLLELERLGAEVKDWLQHRRAEDSHSQYRTQLEAIEALTLEALAGLKTGMDALQLGDEVDEFYEACRLFDLRILWLRRVWQFFKAKFDQRDDPVLGPALRAADEVAWSCYREVFTQSEQWAPAVKQGAVPLPFIESHYSPQAFPTEIVPRDLQTEVEVGFLREHLSRLPVPVVRIPPSCVAAPWQLVWLAHEMGHNVQYDLLADASLVVLFEDHVTEAVEGHGGDSADSARWGKWSREIFADVFSVLMMGPWAVRAIEALELTTAENMYAPRERYPSPFVRLKLMVCATERLGLDGFAWPGPISPTIQLAIKSANRDLEFVGPIVEAALATLPGMDVPLTKLTNFRPENFAPDGPVDGWRGVLRGSDQLKPTKTLQAARLLASATMAAWLDIAAIEDDVKRRSEGRKLAQRALRLIADSRDEGSRDVTQPILTKGLGAELAQVLLQADHQALAG